MHKILTVSAALAALTSVGVGAIAQTPPPPPPAHHGIFSKLFHPKPKPVQPVTGSFGQPGHMMPGHMMPGHMMPGHMMPGHMMPGHMMPGHMMPGHMMPGHMMPGHMMPGHMMPGHMMPGHMMPGHSGMMGSPGMMHGGVVGNKNSHVYHLPGDKGALPAAQNRIYFPTAAAAEAKGYHRSGSARATMSRPMMHGSPMHGMPMHGQPTPGGMTH